MTGTAGSGHAGIQDQGPYPGFLLKKVGNPYGNILTLFGGGQEFPGLDSELDNNARKTPEMTLFKGHSGWIPRSYRELFVQNPQKDVRNRQ